MLFAYELFRGVCLLAVWVTISFPLWSFVVNNTSYRVVDFLPFSLNAMSLLGRSYEAISTDGRIFSINMLLAAPLAVASIFETFRSADTTALTVVGFATLASILGALPEFRLSRKVSEKFERRITFAKVAGIVAVSGVSVWVILIIRGYSNWDLAIQSLMASTVVVASIESLAYVKCRDERKQEGVGSPLLWLAARQLLSFGVHEFWFWALISLVSFTFLNLRHKRAGLFQAIETHARGWSKIELFNSSVSFSLSLVLFLLVSNGQTVRVEVTPTDSESQYLSSYLDLLDLATKEAQSSCVLESWRGGGVQRLLGLLDQKLPEFAPIFVHYMYQNPAAIIATLLLVANSVAILIRRFKDPSASQGYWQPVFFISVLLGIFLYQETDVELMARITDHSRRVWSDDALGAMTLCIFGTLFTILVAAFKRDVTGAVIREKTIYSSPAASSDRVESVALGFVFGAIAILVFLRMVVGIVPNGLTYTEIVHPLNQVSFEHAASNDKDGILLLYLSQEALGNETAIINNHLCFASECLQSARLLEDCNVSYAGGMDGWSSWLRLNQALELKVVHFSLSSLMSVELMGVGILFLLLVISTMLSFRIPVLDELGLAGSATGLIVLISTIPLRITEIRTSDNITGTFGEWYLPTLTVIVGFSVVYAIFVRLDSKKIRNPWMNFEELETEFCSSALSAREFIYKASGFNPNSDNLVIAYQELLTASGDVPPAWVPSKTVDI